MKTINTIQASKILGLCLSMTQRYCQRLGFDKTGRDYQLTPGMVNQIRRAREANPPGRPKKGVDKNKKLC
jgi:hypothetical protein